MLTLATGAASALGRISALLDDRREPTPLPRRLAALGRILAAVTLALRVLVFALGLVRGLPLGTGAMRRPPRPPEQHILGGGAWQRLLVLPAFGTTASLGAGLSARALDLAWQSVLFLALLAAQPGVVLGLRARLFTGRNPFLPLSVLASALLAGAALYVPFLSSVLETEPLGWAGAGLGVAAAPVGFVAARLVRTAFRGANPAGASGPSGLP
ncbi:cation transporting ATPase C-terminal domain-containing protein [Streptomyces sp. NPDC058583]|uniref:cation transporting ATPase C-terminal domain-containing protein n=1 Tax=unclassified Streptomyces TaxID=2593676 RepID=UPI00364F3C19